MYIFVYQEREFILIKIQCISARCCCRLHSEFIFTLQTIKEDGAQQISLNVGTYLMTELAKLRDKYEIIGDVRGKGLQIGVEMVKDKVLSL